MIQQLNEADGQMVEYKRRFEALERENAKIREDLRIQQDDFYRQIDQKDHELRLVATKLDSSQQNNQAAESLQLLRKENDAYK